MEKFDIIIVDDTEINRIVLITMLKNMGYSRIHTAKNGKQALEIIDTLSDVPILILLDLLMPEMDGYEMLRFLKKNASKYKQVKVIVQTVVNNVDAKKILDKYPVIGYINKPIRQEELEQKINLFSPSSKKGRGKKNEAR